LNLLLKHCILCQCWRALDLASNSLSRRDSLQKGVKRRLEQSV
jgi:hypothetical protein